MTHPDLSRADLDDPTMRLEIVRAAWQDVLGLNEPPAPDAKFFEEGGDSLRLVILVEQLTEVAGRPLRTVDFFRTGTVRGHADILGGAQ